jgi:hypothetical protein
MELVVVRKPSTFWETRTEKGKNRYSHHSFTRLL